MSEIDMSQAEMDKLLDEVEQDTKDVVDTGANKDLPPSNNFDGSDKDEKKKEDKPKDTRYLPMLEATISSTKMAKPGFVQQYNNSTALLHGYFVNEAAKLQFSLSKQVVLVNGKKQLRMGVTDEVRRQFEGGGVVAPEDFHTEFAYRMTQSRPGPIIAAILTINRAGIIDPVKLRTAGLTLVPDEEKYGETKLTQVIRKELLPAYLSIHFGDLGIKEDPETHGSRTGTVIVENTRSRKVPEGIAQAPRDFVNQVAKNKSRSSLILPTNHLPRKVHETIEFKNDITNEDLALLNESTFRNLHASEIKKKDQASQLKRDSIRGIMRDYVTKEDGKIASRYFTRDASKRIAIDIKPYYAAKGSEEKLKVLKFPVRHEVVSQTKPENAPRWMIKSYDILDKQDMDGENREKTSYLNGEYSVFIDVLKKHLAGDILEEFAKVARKPRTGGDKVNKVSSDDILKILVLSNDDATTDKLLVLNNRKPSDEAKVLDELYTLTLQNN